MSGEQSGGTPFIHRTPIVHFLASSWVYSEPLGVVLIIGPWNYPFQLLISPLIGAITAGNCSVLKTSEVAPHSSEVVARVIGENFDPGFISVVEGDEEVAETLLTERFDLILFTGSHRKAKSDMAAAARHLTPVTLELGGKSPCVVDRDVHVEYTARRIAWGKFFTAGQTCIAPDYLLVDRTVKQELLEGIAKHVRAFYGADPAKSPDFGKIMNDEHFARLARLLREGDIVIGGDTDASHRYIAPTVIDNVSLELEIMQEEIFGPILPVVDYEQLSEAILLVNERPKPLALYFFSRDKEKQRKVLDETSAGGGCINDTIAHFASALPFGGVGASGIGSYHGKASFDVFSHQRSVLKKSFLLEFFQDPPILGDPYLSDALRRRGERDVRQEVVRERFCFCSGQLQPRL